MSDLSADILVVGAGVVGLAITRRLALEGRSVILIESNPSFGMETSSRNSEVIHAGIYYPTDSLRARLCVRGAAKMYAYCDERGITANRCGKLIVATDESQVEAMAALKEKGDANQVPGLALLGKAAVKSHEPALHAVAAIYSPASGVVDSHSLMAALEGDADNAGATIAYQSHFVSAARTASGYDVRITSQGEEMTLAVGGIVNAAGHGARQVSLNIEGFDAAEVPPHYMAKGQYFTTTRKPPFRHLIYPMPSGGGLGIHLTLDSGGGARFGPDINWVDEVSYDVDPASAARFHESITQYWPELEVDDLVPAWAGLRPKIIPDGSRFADFTFLTVADHGAENVTALHGIDSPGLTSSLAIADHLVDEVGV
ncbi:MAG: NAD(P)/FAD-dependent oxidoreductase [Candidatus Puniceispirillales bacterium]